MAIRLRKAGLTYREILEKVPASKSSISLWLRDTPLTADEKSALKRRRNDQISRGRIRAAAALRKARLARETALHADAENTYQKNKHDELFRVGIALYWAEGAKRGNSFSFINSDPDMVVVMIEWMNKFLHIPREEIRARLYIHKPYAHESLEAFWATKTGIPMRNFRQTIYKPTGSSSKKRPDYKGCLRIEAGGISALRTYQFWQKMMFDNLF